jgi:hypothetical protein
MSRGRVTPGHTRPPGVTNVSAGYSTVTCAGRLAQIGTGRAGGVRARLSRRSACCQAALEEGRALRSARRCDSATHLGRMTVVEVGSAPLRAQWHRMCRGVGLQAPRVTAVTPPDTRAHKGAWRVPLCPDLPGRSGQTVCSCVGDQPRTSGEPRQPAEALPSATASSGRSPNGGTALQPPGVSLLQSRSDLSPNVGRAAHGTPNGGKATLSATCAAPTPRRRRHRPARRRRQRSVRRPSRPCGRCGSRGPASPARGRGCAGRSRG